VQQDRTQSSQLQIEWKWQWLMSQKSQIIMDRVQAEKLKKQNMNICIERTIAFTVRNMGILQRTVVQNSRDITTGTEQMETKQPIWQ